MTSISTAPRTTYRVSFPDPHTHLIHVEARFAAVDELGAHADLRMAAWTPGSYLVRDYARHVQGLTVDAAEDGRRLAVEKLDKATWRVTLDGARDLIARYRVFAHELTVRTNHVDASHAFVNGAPTFLWLDERRGEPCSVSVDAPAGWRVVPGNEMLSADLDALIDTPIHAGPGAVLTREAAGRPFDLAVWGRAESAAATVDQLADDCAKIIEAQAKLFGGVPYDRYTFILMLAANSYGGLEHKHSSALLTTPFAFASRKRYEELLELASHEFFHLWNIKRVRPRGLGPFDYTRENHTRALWVAEGVTSYYDRLFLRRARLQPAKRYLDKLAEDWTALMATPGRRLHSLEEASFDAWIKYYRPDENSGNSSVSYYLKGALVAATLDLEIRRRTAGVKSLDDAMLHLWRAFERDGAGFDDARVMAEIGAAVGLELEDVFARAVRGREDPELPAALRAFGYLLRPKPNGGADADERPSVWLGMNTRVESGRLVVSSAIAGGPAALGGLYGGDEVVAVNGWRITGDERSLADALLARRPGDVVRVTAFRRDELVELSLAVAERPPMWEIVAAPDAKEAERGLGKAWLGQD